MKQTPKSLAVVTGVLLLGLAAGLAWQGASNRPASGERKPLYYQDSMHPWIKSDRPGKCTICEMDLTPIYEGQAGFGAGDNLVALSSNQVTVLNVQTEPVKRRALSRTLRSQGPWKPTRAAKPSSPPRAEAGLRTWPLSTPEWRWRRDKDSSPSSVPTWWPCAGLCRWSTLPTRARPRRK